MTTTVRPVVDKVPLPRPAPGGTDPDDPDIVEVWGRDSFPASDPPANW
ncbi:hypothetical protein [Nucisporomicrobium flavum]|jgi:hypothetical protein|nr:hypothetical protein [Nucisporomicrobium flavum]